MSTETTPPSIDWQAEALAARVILQETGYVQSNVFAADLEHYQSVRTKNAVPPGTAAVAMAMQTAETLGAMKSRQDAPKNSPVA